MTPVRTHSVGGVVASAMCFTAIIAAGYYALDGRWVDCHVMGLLRHEWAAARRA